MSLEISRAIQILNGNGVVGIPTETVYGLAARIDRPEALKKIFETKKRPFFDPLIVHVSHPAHAKDLTTVWSPATEALCEKFWPGPLTVILPKAEKVNALITSGLDTVGIRCPAHPVARKIIEEVGVPLAAPSANRFGHTSPTTALHVKTELPDVYVVDGGSSHIGIESTILKITGSNPCTLSILRKGFITKTQIEILLKLKNIPFNWEQAGNEVSAPGQLKHHYMPDVPLVYLAKDLALPELKIEIAKQAKDLPEAVDGIEIKKPNPSLNNIIELDFSKEPEISSRELYQKLREAAEMKPDLILFKKQSWQNGENWAAFLDRIYKAATLRIE